MNEREQKVFEDAIAFVNRSADIDGEGTLVDPESDLMWGQASWINRDASSERIPDTEDYWCGTSCCVAGYVTLQAALEQTVGTVHQEDQPAIALEFARDYARAELGMDEDDIETEGEDIIGVVAARLMGLRNHEADELFNGVNSRARINLLAAGIREDHAALAAITAKEQ